MKFLNLILNRKLAMVLVLPALLLYMTGCDDDTTIIDIVEDGFYMTGTATGVDGLKNEFALQDGRVEGEGFASNARTGMVEGFGYLSAGDLNFVSKLGSLETSYGAGSQSTQVETGDCGDQIVASIETGALQQDGAAISIPSAGFYHVTVDMTSMSFHAYKIGDFEFTDGFQTLAQASASASGASWSGTDIQIDGNGKFRWNEGWKVIAIDGADTDCDETAGNGEWATSYIIFSNFGKGDNADEFRMGGGEWTVDDLTGTGGAGLYTVGVSFTPGTGWSLSLTRTGDIPAADLSGESLAIIGDGVIIGGNPVGWGGDALGQLPTQSGAIYSWTYTDLEFDGASGFKFRSTGTWEGTFNLGCDFASYDGPNGSDVSCLGGVGSDLACLVGNTYTLVVSIDGNDVAGGKTLTVTAQ